MNDKLSVYKIGTVTKHLQEVLKEEVDTLLADIEYIRVGFYFVKNMTVSICNCDLSHNPFTLMLKDCLDNEADYRSESSMAISREPTLTGQKYIVASKLFFFIIL